MVGDSGTPALLPARQQMQERVNEVRSKAGAAIKELGEDPPKIIYHYTNADGLLGILGSNRLWATNAFYVNDTSEIVYCADVIGKAIDEQLKRFPSDESMELARRLRETVNMFGLVLEPYIVCFCEKSDLLSQWRVTCPLKSVHLM